VSTPLAEVDEASAWELLLGLAHRGASASPAFPVAGIELCEAAPRGWQVVGAHTPAASVERLLDLYLPLCVGPRAHCLVLAHLATSLDGRVATESGNSQFISGHEDLLHTHRLRALFDAVVVGASTVEHDDPRLTTRMVEGPSPTRVILDPRGRLGCEHHVFADESVDTIVIRHAGHGAAMPERTTVIEHTGACDDLPAAFVLASLRARGLRRIFIEGGGITVSRFLAAGTIDRLHITVAPVILGSGRPAFVLPTIETLDAALRLPCDHFPLGGDVLFDCPIRSVE